MSETKNSRQPVAAFETQQDWAGWLEERHATSDGVWLKLAKKGSGLRSVSYEEALDVALCYGWIDGQKSGLDDRCWLQRFTPRKPRSRWSQVNCARTTELIGQGKMKTAGLREVERAKADGRWDAAYPPQSTARVPADLQQELDEHPEAAECFSRLKSADRYSILYKIHDAKKPETRARRIREYVQMLSEHRVPRG